MPTLHIGPRSSEEFDREVKAYTFIVMGDGGYMGDISRSN